jgi:hypothetical protein
MLADCSIRSGTIVSTFLSFRSTKELVVVRDVVSGATVLRWLVAASRLTSRVLHARVECKHVDP